MNIPLNSQFSSFDSLAHKLRMQKFDKNEILKLKNDAISNERLKLRKRKSVLRIQKVFKGYLLRKKFKLVIEEINNNIIIEYFKEKRRQRIRENYKEIILRNLDKYIDRQRTRKRFLLVEYFNFCASLISKNFQGFVTRKKIKPKLEVLKNFKEKIGGVINGYRTRLILRSLKIQDIIIEIANIHNCLNSLNSEDRTSDKTEKLRTDLKRKLPKKLGTLYDEFYKLKRTGYWANITRTHKCWLYKYNQIMIIGEPKSIFEENNSVMNQSIFSKRGRDKERDNRELISNNNFIKENIDMKIPKIINENKKNQYKRKFNPTFNELPDENFKEEKIFKENKIQNSEEDYNLELVHQNSRKTGNFNNNYVIQDEYRDENQDQDQDQNEDIDYLNNFRTNVKKSKNGKNQKNNKNKIYSNEKNTNQDLHAVKSNLNEFSNLEHISIEENNPNFNDGKDIHEASFSEKPKIQIKSNEGNNKNKKLDIFIGSKENSPRLLPSNQLTPQNNFQTSDYDNRPIRTNPKNAYELNEFPLGDDLGPEGEYRETQLNTEDNSTNNKRNKKKKKIEKNHRKQPKYDARKAIEEAAKKQESNQGENLNDERGAFRKFLKEMRSENTKEQPKAKNSGLNNMNSQNNEDISSDKKKKPIVKNEKASTVLGGGGLGSGTVTNLDSVKYDSNLNEKSKNKKEDECDPQKKKKENERNLRKKLHEMEKSHPPRVSIYFIQKK